MNDAHVVCVDDGSACEVVKCDGVRCVLASATELILKTGAEGNILHHEQVVDIIS